MIIFTVILQASTCFFLLFFYYLFIYLFFQASTSDLSIQKENNETTFTIGESRTISNANDTQAQQVAPAKATRTTRHRGTEEQETGISEAL